MSFRSIFKEIRKAACSRDDKIETIISRSVVQKHKIVDPQPELGEKLKKFIDASLDKTI